MAGWIGLGALVFVVGFAMFAIWADGKTQNGSPNPRPARATEMEK